MEGQVWVRQGARQGARQRARQRARQGVSWVIIQRVRQEARQGVSQVIRQWVRQVARKGTGRWSRRKEILQVVREGQAGGQTGGQGPEVRQALGKGSGQAKGLS